MVADARSVRGGRKHEGRVVHCGRTIAAADGRLRIPPAGKIASSASWRAKGRHPRLALPQAAKPWMPTFVGMTRGARSYVNLFAGWYEARRRLYDRGCFVASLLAMTWGAMPHGSLMVGFSPPHPLESSPRPSPRS